VSLIIILSHPQLPENIGAVARVMLNFNLRRLRLINPPPDFLNEKSRALAAGAEVLLEEAEVFDSLPAAVADLTYLYGTTSNEREMIKQYASPRVAMATLHDHSPITTGILFGPERTGLTNEDLTMCQTIITIPVNPGFSSLNLAQAVAIIGYEWLQHSLEMPNLLHTGQTQLATQQQIQAFLADLEDRLDRAKFWRVPHKKPTMWRNLRNIFTRLDLTEQEIRTLRGMLDSLDRR